MKTTIYWLFVINIVFRKTLHVVELSNVMMTSSNGNIFRVTGPLCRDFTGHWGEFPSQRPVTRSFDVFFYQWLNKRLSKQPRHRWFETPLCSLWRRCDVSGHGSGAVLLPGFAIDWSIAKSDNKTAALPWPDPLYVLVWRCECIVHGLFRATEFSGDIYALMNSLLHSKSTGVQFTVKPGIFTKS